MTLTGDGRPKMSMSRLTRRYKCWLAPLGTAQHLCPGHAAVCPVPPHDTISEFMCGRLGARQCGIGQVFWA